MPGYIRWVLVISSNVR